jgi:hypothetical protein
MVLLKKRGDYRVMVMSLKDNRTRSFTIYSEQEIDKIKDIVKKCLGDLKDNGE